MRGIIAGRMSDRDVLCTRRA